MGKPRSTYNPHNETQPFCPYSLENELVRMLGNDCHFKKETVCSLNKMTNYNSDTNANGKKSFCQAMPGNDEPNHQVGRASSLPKEDKDDAQSNVSTNKSCRLESLRNDEPDWKTRRSEPQPFVVGINPNFNRGCGSCSSSEAI